MRRLNHTHPGTSTEQHHVKHHPSDSRGWLESGFHIAGDVASSNPPCLKRRGASRVARHAWLKRKRRGSMWKRSAKSPRGVRCSLREGSAGRVLPGGALEKTARASSLATKQKEVTPLDACWASEVFGGRLGSGPTPQESCASSPRRPTLGRLTTWQRRERKSCGSATWRLRAR